MDADRKILDYLLIGKSVDPTSLLNTKNKTNTFNFYVQPTPLTLFFGSKVYRGFKVDTPDFDTQKSNFVRFHPFPTPWKHHKTLWFPDVAWEQRNGPLGKNWLR